MKSARIGFREGAAMGIIFTSAKVFLAMPRTMVEAGASAAWLIVLIAVLIGSLSWVALYGVLQRFPGKTLVAATELTFGPWLGVPLNLAYAAFYMFTTFIVLREFAENIVVTVLPKTPIDAVLITLVVSMAYMAYLGVEPICRTAWLVGPFMLVGTVIMLGGGLITYRAVSALLPFWGTGPLMVVGYGLLKSSLMADLLIFGLVGPAFRRRRELVQAAWWTVAGAGMLLVGSVLVYEIVFPFPASRRIAFPLLEICRGIIAGRFFQRLEALFVVIWIFAALIKMALGLYGAAESLAQTLRLPSHRQILLPLALLTFSLSLLPRSLPEAVAWDTDILRNFAWTVSILLPAITWLWALVRGRGEVSDA